MIVYVSGHDNRIAVMELEDDTGAMVELLQVVDPVVDTLPTVITLASRQKQRGRLFGAFTTPLVMTEWILQHPRHDLLYALTSFQSHHSAYISTFRILPGGRLEHLGVVETGGLQAVYGTFSPNGNVLVVVHANDGNVSFFDTSSKQALDAPLIVLETPALRKEARSTEVPDCLPSLVHAQYAPNGQYLLTVDASRQSRIWTYPVGPDYLPLQHKPLYNQRLLPIRSPPI